MVLAPRDARWWASRTASPGTCTKYPVDLYVLTEEYKYKYMIEHGKILPDTLVVGARNICKYFCFYRCYMKIC